MLGQKGLRGRKSSGHESIEINRPTTPHKVCACVQQYECLITYSYIEDPCDFNETGVRRWLRVDYWIMALDYVGRRIMDFLPLPLVIRVRGRTFET